jgi:signal transduction histidine kinase
MSIVRDRSDQRALVVAGLGGLLLLGLPSAVELAPWRRGELVPGPGGELVLGVAGPPFIAWLALVILVATIVPGALAIVVLLRTQVIEWPRGRRLAALAGLAFFVGLTRTSVLVIAIPGIVPGPITVAEILLSSAEALVALGLATYYVDTRRRIRADERARIEEERRAAEVQAELEHEELRVRREVSRRLHGGLQQRLVLLIGELESIRDDLESRGETSVARSVGHVSDNLDQIREDEVRAVAHALYPLAADIDLSAALLLLADQLPPSVRMDIHFESGGEALVAGSSLPATDRVTLFSIVEEGITNAVRHGRARAIRVLLGADRVPDAAEATAHVLVDDDGDGLDGPPELSGLAGLRARVRRRGGELTIGPSPLGGARLAVNMPVASTAHGAGNS